MGSGLLGAVARPIALVDQLARWSNRRRDLWFDRKYGIETVTHEVPEVVGAHHFEIYAPTPTRSFSRMIRASGVDPAAFTFVDLGAGKGRMLFMASEAGFAQVWGVEFDAALCAAARRNIERATGLDGARPAIIEADAQVAPFPDGDLFVFMFNPFGGPVFEAVANRLSDLAAENRAVVVAYNNDICGDVLEATGAFKRVRLRPLRFWSRPKTSFFYNEAAWKLRRR